jgi:hypothetical protein
MATSTFNVSYASEEAVRNALARQGYSVAKSRTLRRLADAAVVDVEHDPKDHDRIEQIVKNEEPLARRTPTET